MIAFANQAAVAVSETIRLSDPVRTVRLIWIGLTGAVALLVAIRIALFIRTRRKGNSPPIAISDGDSETGNATNNGNDSSATRES